MAAAERLGTALGLVGVIEAVAVEAALRQPPPARRAGCETLTDALVERAARLADEARRLAGRPPRARMAAFLPLPLLRRRRLGCAPSTILSDKPARPGGDGAARPALGPSASAALSHRHCAAT
ncbi:MAG: hypothetical protein U1E17_08440 [Geminicoccaceae bacterium]